MIRARDARILRPVTAVAKKLHIRPGSIVWVRGEASRIGALPARAVVTSRASKRVTHAVLFVTKTAEIAAIARQRASLPPIVWIAYPKKTSGVSSELTRDEGGRSA